MRRLIVNADDYGQDNGDNVCPAIIKAYRSGILTSTTVLVNYVTMDQVQELLDSKLPAGLHVQKNFDEIPLFYNLFEKLPTHMDSHRFRMYEPDMIDQFYYLSLKNNFPIRRAARAKPRQGKFSFAYEEIPMEPVYKTTDHLFTTYFHDKPNPVKAFIQFLKELPEGTSEVVFHPAFRDGTEKGDKRLIDFMILTDRRVKQAVKDFGIELISFADL